MQEKCFTNNLQSMKRQVKHFTNILQYGVKCLIFNKKRLHLLIDEMSRPLSPRSARSKTYSFNANIA